MRDKVDWVREQAGFLVLLWLCVRTRPSFVLDHMEEKFNSPGGKERGIDTPRTREIILEGKENPARCCQY